MTLLTAYFGNMISGATPLERLDALKKYQADSGINPWFLILGLVVIAILTALLLAINYQRKKNSQVTSSQKLFDEYARAKGLTDREYRILINIANGIGLKRNEYIFTLPTAFDRETANMIKNAKSEGDMEQTAQLEAELAALRQKLDFRRYTSPNTVSAEDVKTQSTRQIPVKKKIYIKRNHRSSNGDLEAIVINNTPEGLTVQFPAPVEIVFSQTWICRYYAVAHVVEFSTTVAKCRGRIALLNHSNHIRRVNRRKVLRVPIQKPAYIAGFPFKKEPFTAADSAGNKPTLMQNFRSYSVNHFEPPRFVPATITELGGPGIRIRTDLPLNTEDRVLVMFKLDHPKKTNAYAYQEKLPDPIIEHIAKVRHIIKDKNGPSVALELIGLSDNEMDELIRATNEASIGMHKQQMHYQPSEVSTKYPRQLVSV